jgi:hypothetical protein
LLVNIKRKAPTGRQQQHSDNTVSVATKDLSAVFDELHRLRERQKDMETKMGDLLKENEMVWQEFGHMRGAHVKQQQITTKLVQFMVALLQPSKRLGKRHLLAIDEFQPKRARESDEDLSLQAVQQHNVGEVLDRLMQEYGVSTSPMRSVPNQLNIRPSNPIISEVTGEEETPRTKQGGYSYSNQYQPQPAQTSQAYMGYDQVIFTIIDLSLIVVLVSSKHA